MKRWDVLGVGCAAVDDLLYLEDFPQPDTKVPIQKVVRQGGGLIATALVTAARQGAKTAYCCRIGFDELSEYTLNELVREGVDCSPCFRAADGSPFHSFILVDQSGRTRTILFQRGNVAPPLEHITAGLISACKVLLIDHQAPAAVVRAANFARQAGIPVVADIESREVPDLDLLLHQIDHLIIGVELAAQLTGQTRVEAMVQQLALSERACCVVTAGDLGCWYSEYGRQVIHYPAFPVPVVDTTGCGDVFHGAYAAALARGVSVPDAIQLATGTAAIKATQPGGRAGVPDLPSVERFIQERHGR